jgi:hypothetical protein
MNQAEIVQQLRKVPLFQEVPLAEFKKGGGFYPLLQLVKERQYTVGEDLFRQGQRAHRFYCIIEGKVRLTRVGQDAITRYLKTLGPGESVGETGLIIGDFHDATAEAVVPSRLLVLERKEFNRFLEENPRALDQLNLSREVQRRLSVPDFDWLREDELVIFTARRHWANLLKRIGPALAVLALIILPLFILPMGNFAFSTWLTVGLGVVIAVVFLYIIWQTVNWRDDFFVLTTERIVHFDRVWPVRRDFEEGALDNVQDTTILQKGIAANALNYGDLILQTAGETVDIDLSGVARPVHLKNLIEKELERTRARRLASVRSDIQEKLKERLESGRLPIEQSDDGSVEREESSASTSFSIIVFARTVLEYFFPPSRSESADGSTIYWRRYWLPGFFQNWHISLLLLGWTLGGIFLFSGVSLLLGLLLVWLVLEAVFFAVFLWNFEDWRNDYFQLTPSDIMLVSQRPLLLERSQQEARLEDIQNLSSEVPNLFGQIFQYGHVTFETAGTQGRFELKWVRFPEDVRSEISQRQQQYKEQQQKMEARRRQDELLQWFDVYDELRNPEQHQSRSEPRRKSVTDSGETDET